MGGDAEVSEARIVEREKGQSRGLGVAIVSVRYRPRVCQNRLLAASTLMFFPTQPRSDISCSDSV